MSIRKVMKGVPTEHIAAKGLLQHDVDSIRSWQRECNDRLAMTIQLEQEAYLTSHPEVMAIMELFIGEQTNKMKRQTNFVKEAADFMLRPFEDVDENIRRRLGIGPEEPYLKNDKIAYHIHDDEQLENDLKAIQAKHFPPKTWSRASTQSRTADTESSTFLSVITSNTTQPTPEPIPTPELTLSEHFMKIVSNVVDKAIFLKVTDAGILYDIAYVELSKAVEEAMEIPVVEIKEDIAELFLNAYELFELDILEKARIAAEIAWEKRMRKKMKRTIRRQANFKGYITPPSTSSEVSSHESYRVPPPKPCICHPQWHFNRYAKDRFGIYHPRDQEFSGINITVTPVISVEKLPEEEAAVAEDEENRD